MCSTSTQSTLKNSECLSQQRSPHGGSTIIVVSACFLNSFRTAHPSKPCAKSYVKSNKYMAASAQRELTHTDTDTDRTLVSWAAPKQPFSTYDCVTMWLGDGWNSHKCPDCIGAAETINQRAQILVRPQGTWERWAEEARSLGENPKKVGKLDEA